MILAAHQAQFAPWLGYFDKMARADVFVLLDNVQFKKNEWQNRNRIKGAAGPQWLTVPVSFRLGQTIREVAIGEPDRWRKRHLACLRSCYGRALHFEETFALYEAVVSRGPFDGLAELNLALLDALRATLRIPTRTVVASELDSISTERDGRLIDLCRRFGCDTYLAGAGGRAYMDRERYRAEGIRVLFQDYRHPVYPQLFGAFEPSLSVVDLLFNCGPESLRVIRGRASFKGESEGDYECIGDRRPSG